MNRPPLLLFAAGLTFLLIAEMNPLLADPLNPLRQEEVSGVIVEQARPAKSLPAVLFANEPSPPKHASGSWYLSIGAGAGFPQYDNGDVVNNNTGASKPLKAAASMAFTSLLSTGYRWFDPSRWGHWSFDVDFVGAYLGTGLSSPPGRGQINLGFLGLRGRVGYRILQDLIEPFLGFAGGGVIVNIETAGTDHGDVWGYWFAPSAGVRYYIPHTRWSLTVEGLFRFVGGLNGFDGPAPGFTINETPHAGLDGGWIYVPLGVVAIGYRF
ncbi:MAG: outer membrane protein [Candidatus Methylacidiphilaceae bacterium]